jgi:alkylation response protein AidB-like acyl-CoA dehydrogenase
MAEALAPMMLPTEEQLEIRALARQVAEGELRPHAEAWDAARAIPAQVFRSLAEVGFLGLRAPETAGGLALDLPTALLAVEALSWGEGSVGLSVAIHAGPVTRAISTFGTEGQRARWLPLLADGSILGAFALSESGAGSDVAAMTTRAEPADEGGWVLNGEKRWVTNGDRAGLLLVLARTGEASEEALTAFLVPRDAPGIRVTGRETTLGLCASETVSLTLEGVRLPPEACLGEAGEGWGVARDALVHGRLFVAAQALGIGSAALEHAVRYAGEREQFGRSLDAFGGIQEKLGAVAIRLAGARALVLETAARVDAAGAELRAPHTLTGALHDPRSLEAAAAMAKVAASEAAMFAADEAVQIFGGYGYMRDYPVEKLMRDAKGTEIYEGTSEVLRWVIARALIREGSDA